MNNEKASINQNYPEYNYKLTPFKLFTLQNFPYIEADFDAITNYELFCKVVEYLNEVIANENTVESIVQQQIDNINILYNWFNELNVQEEINNKLDEMTENGTLTLLIKNYVDPITNNLIETVNQQLDYQNNKINVLESGSPLVASSTSGMTDTTRVYVNTSDGNWYYYNGSAWTIGGQYQSTGIANNSINQLSIQNESIIPSKIYNTIQNIPMNLLKYTFWFNNTNINANTGETTSQNGYLTSDYIFVGDNKTLFCTHLNGSRYNCIYEYDNNKSFVNRLPVTTTNEFTLQESTVYIRYVYNINPEGTEFGNTVYNVNGNDYNSINWLNLNSENFIENIISPYSLIDTEKQPLKEPFKFTKWKKGYRLYSGKEIVYNLYCISDYERINNSSLLTFNKEFESPARLELYNSNKELIASKNGFGIVHQIETQGAYYIRVSIPISEISDFYCVSNIGQNKVNIPWLNSNYTNKRGLVYGDSLWSNCKGNFNYTNTPYHQSTDKCIGYQQYLENNGIEINNQALSGTTVTQCYDNQGLMYPQNITTEELSNYDFVIISFGRNDSRSLEIGTIQSINNTDYDTNTFIGAYQSIINTLLQKNPKLRIILWTMTQSNANGYGTETVNSRGYKQRDYVNAVIELGKLYSANVVNLYDNSGINELNLSEWTFEGVHLTNEGYKFTSEYYVNKMMNILKD